jgi:hypothetical protein
MSPHHRSQGFVPNPSFRRLGSRPGRPGCRGALAFSFGLALQDPTHSHRISMGLSPILTPRAAGSSSTYTTPGESNADLTSLVDRNKSFAIRSVAVRDGASRPPLAHPRTTSLSASTLDKTPCSCSRNLHEHLHDTTR